MTSILDFFSAKQRLRDRTEWALGMGAPFGASTMSPTPAEAERRRPLRPVARPAEPDPLYFNVRSFASGDEAHTLQFGFVDRDANVVLSVFVKAPSPIPRLGGPLHDALSVDPLEPDSFERLLAPICRGVTLVGFHRVLQGGLLPSAALEGATAFRCVWRRMQEAAKVHRLCAPKDRPMTLNEGLALAGLPMVDTEDAAMRAMAIRDLWLWLDRLG
jgi:hypothetical protein